MSDPEYFLPLDLETTGLDERRLPSQLVGHVPIEVAARILKPGRPPTELARMETTIRPLLGAMASASDYAVSMHKASGLLDRALDSETTLDVAEKQILKMITENCGSAKVTLLGNSVHFDRRFMRRYMPDLHARCHYRELDITAVNLFQTLYGVEDPMRGWAKEKAHTAQADLDETMKEADLYARNLGLLNDDG